MVLTVQRYIVSEINSPWWANVHCKSNLTINKLSYSYSYF